MSGRRQKRPILDLKFLKTFFSSPDISTYLFLKHVYSQSSDSAQSLSSGNATWVGSIRKEKAIQKQLICQALVATLKVAHNVFISDNKLKRISLDFPEADKWIGLYIQPLWANTASRKPQNNNSRRSTGIQKDSECRIWILISNVPKAVDVHNWDSVLASCKTEQSYEKFETELLKFKAFLRQTFHLLLLFKERVNYEPSLRACIVKWHPNLSIIFSSLNHVFTPFTSI